MERQSLSAVDPQIIVLLGGHELTIHSIINLTEFSFNNELFLKSTIDSNIKSNQTPLITINDTDEHQKSLTCEII